MQKISSLFDDLSIKWRLFLLQAVLSFLIVASIGIISVLELQGSIENNQRDRLLAVVSEVANLSANNLRNAGAVLRNLAKSAAIYAYYTHGDREELESEFIKREILFPEISFIRPGGQEEVKVIAGKSVVDYKDYSGSAVLHLASTHRGSVVMGTPYISASMKGPVVDMVCQGCSDGHDQDFILRASLPLNLLKNAVSDIEISSGGFFILLDENGYVLAASLPDYLALRLSDVSMNEEIGSEQLLAGKQLFGRYRLLGCDCVIAEGSATLSDIRAVVAMPYAAYQAPIRHLRQSILIICLVAFSASILIVSWMVRRFMAPINLLTKAAVDIAQDGSLNRHVEWQSKDEIGVLANSFNTMLSRLICTHRELIYERSYVDNILLSLADMLVVTDTIGIITRVNISCQDRLKYHYSDIVGRPIGVLFKEGDALISSIVGNIDQADVVHNVETTMLTSNRLEIPVMISVAVIKDENVQVPCDLVFIAKDITERKRAEAELRCQHEELQESNRRLEQANNQLLQSEKLAAIGQLAAGVAHEINNPIGYVNSNLATLELYVGNLLHIVNVYIEAEPLLKEHRGALEAIRNIKESMDLDYLKKDLIELLRESREGMMRVKEIVADLKSFSRVDSQELQWCDLHMGMDATLNIVHNELKYKVTLIKEYGDIPDVECNLGQINQVFMNLLVNAAQAIEDRGTVWIRTGTEGGWVRIEIEDTGKGIPPEHLNRIFEPFFTTKPIGKGTGLGLSLSYGIIEKHGGHFEVDSTVGKGTRFRIWLPHRTPSANARVVAGV